MSKLSVFAIKKLYFKLIFNSVSGNCDPQLSQKNFDHTLSGGFVHGVYVRGVYVLEPQMQPRDPNPAISCWPLDT